MTAKELCDKSGMALRTLMHYKRFNLKQPIDYFYGVNEKNAPLLIFTETGINKVLNRRTCNKKGTPIPQ
jgi:hypothetical protein